MFDKKCLLFLLIHRFILFNPIPLWITMMDDIHDFVDVVVGEVFVIMVGGEVGGALKPAPDVLEKPAEAGPENAEDADVDEHGEDHDDQHAEDNLLGSDDVFFCAVCFLVLLLHECIHFLLLGGVTGIQGRLVEVEIILNLCGVGQRTVLFERVHVGPLLLSQLRHVLTQRHLVEGLFSFPTTAEQSEADECEDDYFLGLTK